MSKFEQVANILGLELGERFCIQSMGDVRFFFTNGGLNIDKPWSSEDINLHRALHSILSGDLKISKMYYIPSFSPYGYERVDLLRLDSDLVAKYKKYNLLCCTADEAKILSDNILDIISRVEIGA